MRIVNGTEAVFHAGEREAHRRFGVEELAREMQGTIAPQLSAGQARFMDAQAFCFITVREPSGALWSQVLPRVETPQGIYPLLAFGDARTFHFLADTERDARLLAGAGGASGLVFVDFARGARLRVNGDLDVVDDAVLPGFRSPLGHRLMQLRVAQAYANCPARIVRMALPKE